MYVLDRSRAEHSKYRIENYVIFNAEKVRRVLI